MANQLQISRGAEINLPTLAQAEFGFTTDSIKLFIGDGVLNHEIVLDASNVFINKNLALTDGIVPMWDNTTSKLVDAYKPYSTNVAANYFPVVYKDINLLYGSKLGNYIDFIEDLDTTYTTGFFNSRIISVNNEIYFAGNNIATNYVIYHEGNVPNWASGTVTSVGMSVPTGFTLAGSPITTSGTLALGFATGYSLLTSAQTTNWNTAYNWGNWNGGMTSSYVPYFNGTNLVSSGIYYDAITGFTGIGTTSPREKLDVTANAIFGNSNGQGIILSNNNAGNGYYSSIRFEGLNSTTRTETSKITGYQSTNADAGNLRFYTKLAGGAITERIRITNNGNVGIGVTDPLGYKLYVNGNGYFAGNITATGTITALGGNSTNWNTAYNWNVPANYLPLTGGTMTGVLSSATNQAYLSVTDLGFKGTFRTNAANLGTGGFSPMLAGTSLISTGYRKHVSIGVYRTGNAYYGGIYLAQGGNDSYPTEYFLLEEGGNITHSLGFSYYHSGNSNLSTVDWAANNITAAGTVTALGGNSTNWNTAYTNRITALTTTGNSGAATLSSNVLNIPIYTLSGLGGQPAGTYDNYVNWSVTDGSATVAIASGDILSITGSAPMYTIVDTAKSLVIYHGGSSLSTNSPASGAVALSGWTSDGYGHITGFNTTTITASLINAQSQLNGTGFVKANGTIISYDNTSYLPLTGGTLTGALLINSNVVNTLTIQNDDNTGINAFRITTQGVNDFIVDTKGNVSAAGNITATGEVTAWTTSDIRLKENIFDITNVSQFLSRFTPIKFNWNSIALELNNTKDNRIEYGLSAQAVKLIAPEFIHTIYDDYLSIDYLKFVPLLIASGNERQKEVDSMRKEINIMQQKIKILENGTLIK